MGKTKGKTKGKKTGKLKEDEPEAEDEDIEKEEAKTEAKEEPETQIPEEWKQIPIRDLVSKGFRPRKKIVAKGGKIYIYITLKYGNEERGLGPYDSDRWELLMSMMPVGMDVPSFSGSEEVSPVSPVSLTELKGLLDVKVRKPDLLKGGIELELDTLNYYKTLQSIGYPGTINDFLNGIVKEYFQGHGANYGLVIKVVGGKENE